MLKKIRVTQVRAGMYIHELCGSWMDHAFWRQRFLVQGEADLKRLNESRLTWVWIDTARGLDVAPEVEPAASEVVSVLSLSEPHGAQTPEDEAGQAYAQARRVREEALDRVTQLFADAGLGRKTDLTQVESVASDIADSIEAHPDALISLVRIKQVDQYTYMHSVAVGALMTSFARAMALPDELVRLAGMGGLLHDIGKMQIPETILNKPGRLTDDEFRLIQKHPDYGVALLREDTTMPAEILDICQHHHEKVNGRGYPHRLDDEGISLLARMGAICDIYDAVTSDRPYKRGWDPAFALAQMQRWEGHLDVGALRVFMELVGRYPVGSVVSLTGGKLGLVVARNPGRPDHPVVKVFHSLHTGLPLPVQTVNLAEPGCSIQILPAVVPVDWAQSELALPPIP